MVNSTKRQPLVSVIVPTYNYEKFIKEAIESVLSQTYKDLELIIIDNYSKDNTEKIVASYASSDSRVRYHKFHNDGIIARSRNFGIKIAKGDYVAFLDSDDFWERNKLKETMQLFEKSPHIDLVCHDEYKLNPDSKIEKLRYGPYTRYEDLLFKDNCLSTSAIVVRKGKLLEAGLFSEDKDFVTAEDYELWLRLSKICRITYLHNPLGNYRIHTTCFSANIETHMRNILNVLNYHFNQWKEHTPYYRFLMNKRKAMVLRRASRSLLSTGDREAALNTIKSALRLNPFSAKAWALALINTIRLEKSK